MLGISKQAERKDYAEGDIKVRFLYCVPRCVYANGGYAKRLASIHLPPIGCPKYTDTRLGAVGLCQQNGVGVALQSFALFALAKPKSLQGSPSLPLTGKARPTYLTSSKAERYAHIVEADGASPSSGTVVLPRQWQSVAMAEPLVTNLTTPKVLFAQTALRAVKGHVTLHLPL